MAYYLGEVVAMSGIPIVGLILLIVGIRQRSRARRVPPGYPPPGHYPYDLPPNPDHPPAPAPPAQQHPDDYSAPRATHSGTALIVVGALMLAFGLFGIVGRAADLMPRQHESQPSVKVGECISQSDLRADNMRPTPQDCDARDSTLEVASTGGGSATCPDGKLKDSQYAVLFDKTTTLCFMLNLRQGQCYSVSGTADNPGFRQEACDGLVPVVQVVKRVDGDYHRSLCPEDTKAVFYVQPARLYCLQPLKK